jgi:hypothetical protein
MSSATVRIGSRRDFHARLHYTPARLSQGVHTVSVGQAQRLAGNVWAAYTIRDRVLLTIGSVACIFVFIWLAGAFGIPAHPRFQGSLLAQPSPVAALIVTLIGLIACVLLASVVASVVHFDAGLFCAAIGLLGLSARGGPLRYVLMYSPGPYVFLTLCAELMLLFAFLGIAWGVLWAMRGRGFVIDDVQRDGLHEEDEKPGHHLLATLMQAVTTAVLVLLLAQTDEKAQVIAAVGVASMLGTMAAHSLFPVSPSAWYWVGPLAVGLIGYGFAYVNADGTWTIGQVSGHFAPLGRPLPLDYAGAGTAGSLLGYWTSRRWQYTKEAEAAAAAVTPTNPATNA